MSWFRRSQAEPLRYGDGALGVVDLYRPAGASRGVIGLIHGGFWLSMYGRDSLVDHCRMLASDGFVVGNLAYRRVGDAGGGWPATGTDVAAGLRALIGAAGPLTATVGHSAGGHLALWAAKEIDPPPVVTISVAGCNDLALGHELGIGQGAVPRLVGGDLALLPSADPAQRLPLGARAVLVVADDDRVVPPALSASYADKARAAGDVVEERVVAGDHFSVLDVGSAVWAAVLDVIEEVA